MNTVQEQKHEQVVQSQHCQYYALYVQLPCTIISQMRNTLFETALFIITLLM